MPKKIPLTEIRQWLENYEQGIPEAQIAKDAKRDVKTVKRGIERAHRERDATAARAELLKEALQKHQNQLLDVIDNVLSALVVPGPDLALNRQRDGSLAPIQLSRATISYDPQKGLVLKLHDENTAQWELLKEHLRHDRLWRMVDRWKEAMIAHIQARTDLKRKTAYTLENTTGYRLVKTPVDPPFLYEDNAVNLLYETALKRALGVQDDVNLEEDIIVDTNSGQVRYHIGLILAEAPGEEEQCKTKILNAFSTIQEAGEIVKVASTHRSLVEPTAKARRAVEEISLLGLVPGYCRVCRRLGI